VLGGGVASAKVYDMTYKSASDTFAWTFDTSAQHKAYDGLLISYTYGAPGQVNGGADIIGFEFNPTAGGYFPQGVDLEVLYGARADAYYKRLVFSGPQMYSGAETDPTYLPGSYAVKVGFFGEGERGVVTIAPGAPGPEIGLGLIPALAALAGLAMTRARRVEEKCERFSARNPL
jgi:hypothetical protein